jgi:hypothetical protein
VAVHVTQAVMAAATAAPSSKHQMPARLQTVPQASTSGCYMSILLYAINVLPSTMAAWKRCNPEGHV